MQLHLSSLHFGTFWQQPTDVTNFESFWCLFISSEKRKNARQSCMSTIFRCPISTTSNYQYCLLIHSCKLLAPILVVDQVWTAMLSMKFPVITWFIVKPVTQKYTKRSRPIVCWKSDSPIQWNKLFSLWTKTYTLYTKFILYSTMPYARNDHIAREEQKKSVCIVDQQCQKAN
jgi:hypothetical protein